MNEEYTYKNGKIYVKNSFGDTVERKYHDKIFEILEQENIVEELNKNIIKLKQEKEEFESKKRDLISLIFTNGNKFNCLTITFLIFVISSLLGLYTVNEFGKNIISNIFHIVGLTSAIALIPTALFQIKNNKKLFNKNLNIIEQQIEEFEPELEFEKEKLANLNKLKTNKNTKKNISVEINNNEIEAIQEIRRKIEFFEELKQQLNSNNSKQKIISRSIKN